MSPVGGSTAAADTVAGCGRGRGGIAVTTL